MCNTRKNKRIIFIVVGLLFIFCSSYAYKVPGYIVTNGSDTLYGEINLYTYNQHNKGLVINGIDLEPFYTMVYFKEEGERKSRKYVPKDIKGFGFISETINYRFNTFKVEHKSIVISEQVEDKFLNLLYSDEIELYRGVVRTQNPANTNVTIDNSTVYFELYLYNKQKGLTKLVKSDEFHTVIDVLEYYEIDKEFLQNLSPKNRFKDIKSILEQYSRWKYNKQLEELKV